MPREISDKSRGRQGRGIIDLNSPESYIPWIKTRDCFHGEGTRHLIPDLYYDNRQIHLMSDLEMQLYYMLRSNENIVDIFEQYPLLPVGVTENLCDKYCIRHPHNPRTGENIVMTTDFIFIMKNADGKKEWIACAVKPSNKLQDKRTNEKLFIEQEYWKQKDIRWGVLTEYQVNKTYVNNVILCKSGYGRIDTGDKYDILKYLIVHNLIDVDMKQRIDLENILDRIRRGDITLGTNVCHEKRQVTDWNRFLESDSEVRKQLFGNKDGNN